MTRRGSVTPNATPAWGAAAIDPAIVRGVLLADTGGTGSVRLRRWNPDTRTFAPAEWPEALAPVRERIRAAHHQFGQKREGMPIRPSELFGPDGASLVMPVSPMAPIEPDGSPGRLTHVFGFTIVLLDLPLIEGQVLPSLVSRSLRPAADERLPRGGRRAARRAPRRVRGGTR